MQKPYTLIIPSWYPTDKQPLNGIFIQKHAQAISTFRNVVVMYISGDTESRVEEIDISDSFSRYSYFYAESSSRGYNQLKYIASQIVAYRRIVKRYGKPSALHLHVVFPAGIFVYLLLLFTNIPLIITEHWTGYMDEDGRYMKQPDLVRYITKTLFQKAKAVSVVSSYFKQLLIRMNLVDKKKLFTVYNILDNPPSAYEQPIDKLFKGLYVGNLSDAQKNISVLIKAVAIVIERYPQFQLTLVGGGSETDRFIKLAEEQGLLNKNIFFKGYVKNGELPAIYQDHGFFILTSHFETFNIAAAEAMMSGLPVVSSHCGGPTEFVNEHTGIWIKKNTTEDTAAAIMEMIERRTEFEPQRIARETQDKFSYDHILRQLKDLYGTVAE